MSEINKIYVIGLDGVPPSLLEVGLQKDRLPTLKKLRDSGSAGFTKSTTPPISMMAWSTFSTGLNPGNHGIYNFILKTPNGHDSRFANRDVLQQNANTMFQYLDSRGIETGVLNVMPGYPVPQTRGYHVSDYITTPPKANFTHPPDLQTELENLVDGYSPGLPSDARTEMGIKQLEEYIERFYQQERKNLKIGRHLIDKNECRLTVQVYSGPDILLHNIGHLLDESHPRYDPKLASEFGEEPINLLKIYDDWLRWLTKEMEDDDMLIILSDHGHGSVYQAVNMNSWLYNNDYLTFKDRWWTKMKLFLYNYLYDIAKSLLDRLELFHFVKRTVARSQGKADGIDLAKLFTISHSDIDWNLTTAFTISGDGQIYINTESVKEVPDAEFHAILHDLKTDLEAVTSDGKNVFERVELGEELYSGRYVDRGPDLVAVPNPGFQITYPQTMKTSEVFGEPHKPSSHTSRNEKYGIFCAWGSQIQNNSDVEMELPDYAPTIFQGLGVPIPKKMDGSVRMELFNTENIQPRRSYDGYVHARQTSKTVIDRVIENQRDLAD